MKLALIGYGKMGKMVEVAATRRSHAVIARLTSQSTAEEWDSLVEADLCIEFSGPDCLVDNLKRIAPLQKEIVVGTTGWYRHLPFVKQLVHEQHLGLLYSPNFSVGMQLFLQLIRSAAALVSSFEEYDVAAVEMHHRHKADVPSGTALAIGNILEEHMRRSEELPWTSVRCGANPGTHTVLFDSPADVITISHQARSREAFASGAIQAAEWLLGRRGFYTFEDCLQALMERKKNA